MNAASFLTGSMKADDVGDVGAESLYTIRSIDERTFDDTEGTKLTVGFEETGKTLVLNRTNLERLIALFGRETGEWLGNKVRLRVEKTSFGGRSVPGIRVIEAA